MVDLTREDIEDHFDLFLWWRATGRKFLPSELEKQETRKLSVLLQLDGLLNKIAEQIEPTEKA
jgi:hypothetical protein